MTTKDLTQCGRCGKPHAGCVGHRRDGSPCGNRPMSGQRVCRMHGGSAPQVKAAAERRLEQAQAERVLGRTLAEAYGGQVPEVDPGEAMLQAVSWKYAEVVALRSKVGELDDSKLVWGRTRVRSDGPDRGVTREAGPHVWWQMLRTAEDQLVRFAAAARAAGCDERRVQLAQAYGLMLGEVIQGILGDLGLSVEQEELVGVVVPRHLRAIGPGTDRL